MFGVSMHELHLNCRFSPYTCHTQETSDKIQFKVEVVAGPTEHAELVGVANPNENTERVDGEVDAKDNVGS